MTPTVVIDIFQQALFVVVLCSMVIIIPGLVVGLFVAVFQAATQINEMTLSFIPRLLVTILALILAGQWLLKELIEYTQTLFGQIPFVIG